MSRFAPTLRLDVTAEQIVAAEEVGMVFEDLTKQITDYLGSVDMTEKPTFTAERITDIETGVILNDYATTIVGRFIIDGALYIKTGTGDIIEVALHRI